MSGPIPKPEVYASKREVIQGWEGFEVTCEVDMLSRSSLDLIWDYPGKGVRAQSFTASSLMMTHQGLEYTASVPA